MNANEYLLYEDSNKYYKFIILIIRLIGIRITDIAQIRSLVILLEKLELLRGSRRARHECPPNAGRRRIKRLSAGGGDLPAPGHNIDHGIGPASKLGNVL